MDPRTATATATANNVVAAIEASGLTRQQVADLSGIPKTTLLRKLHGHASFTLDEIDRLARALGTTSANLIAFEAVA
jgi:transcriptional regulator with XRE-family HTH domain